MPNLLPDTKVKIKLVMPLCLSFSAHIVKAG